MPKNYVDTVTAAGFRRLHKNAAVLILTDKPGVTMNGIIRSPGQMKSLVRYNEAGTLRERKISNTALVPVRPKPKSELPEVD